MKTAILNRNPLRGIVLAGGLAAALLLTAGVAHARGGHRGHPGGGHRGHHRTVGHHRASGHHRTTGHHRSHHRTSGHRGHHRSHRYYRYPYSSNYGYYRYRSYRYRYPSYRYRYRSYRYPYVGSGQDGTERTRETHDSSQPAAPYATGGSHDKSRSDLTGLGWVHLREGRPDTALQVFAREAPLHPNDGVIKVGYALASAARGDRSRGVWAMRRALRIDPKVLHYIHLDDQLRSFVRRLVDTNARYPDQAFMVAALHYLLRNREAAQEAIHRAGRDGAASTKNLARLIGEMPGAKKVPHKNEAGARKPERKKDAKPATRGSPDAGTAPPRKRGKDY